MAFQIRITIGSPAPVFRQIADQVRHAIATGILTAGEPLPSVRTLAEQLLLNPKTVARAYADLVRDGVLETTPGKGVTIAPPRQVYTKTERLRRFDPAISTLINEAVALGFSAREVHDLIDKKMKEMNLHSE